MEKPVEEDEDDRLVMPDDKALVPVDVGADDLQVQPGSSSEPPHCKLCGFTRVEFLFTIVIILLSIEINFSVDVPASLQTAITQVYHLDEYDFSLLYTMYSLPSFCLNAFAGYFIDKVMGIRSSSLVYSCVATLGVVLFAVAAVTNLFWLMIIGRLIFGLGNEIVASVCMSYCIFRYSNKRCVNFLFSLSDNLSYLGNVAVFQCLPLLYGLFSESLPADKALKLVIVIASSTYIVMILLSLLMTCLKPSGDSIASAAGDDHDESVTLKLTDIIRFPAVFWILCVVYCCFVTAVTMMETFSQKMLTSDLFHLSTEEASNAVTVMNIVKMALSIPLSITVDRLGYNIAFVTAACFVCVVACILLLLSCNPYITMVLFGASYSLIASSIWPMFAYPVGSRYTASVYGIVSAVGGFSQTISPSIVGSLIDTYSYPGAITFYLACAAGSLFFIIFAWVLDVRIGILQRSQSDRLLAETRLRSDSNEGLLDGDVATTADDTPP